MRRSTFVPFAPTTSSLVFFINAFLFISPSFSVLHLVECHLQPAEPVLRVLGGGPSENHHDSANGVRGGGPSENHQFQFLATRTNAGEILEEQLPPRSLTSSSFLNEAEGARDHMQQELLRTGVTGGTAEGTTSSSHETSAASARRQQESAQFTAATKIHLMAKVAAAEQEKEAAPKKYLGRDDHFGKGRSFKRRDLTI